MKKNFYLKEHNQKAYNNVIKMFQEGKKRVAVVHPTGTGKSYIGMQWIKDNPQKKTIIVSPTRAIINQYKKNLKKSEIDASNVEYLTYSQLLYMTPEELKSLGAENIILEEFHHIGGPKWMNGVNALLEANNNANVLGLSATPIRYLDKMRDMVEEIFEGNVASEMSLAEAILDGLLEVPEYHQALYSVKGEEERIRKEIEELSDEDEKILLREKLKEVKDATSKMNLSTKGILESGISEDRRDGRFIIFCKNIKDMHKAMRKAQEWFSGINEVEMYSMATKDYYGQIISNIDNEAQMELFEKSTSKKIKLMFAVDMLSEGVHPEGIDGVIMLRGTNSPRLYRQFIGRALSIGGKKDPLIFDFADNISCTRYVYELYKEMEQTITKRRQEGKDTSKEEAILKNFRIDDHIKEFRELITELDDNTYSKKWDQRFEQLKQYIYSSEEKRKYLEETGNVKWDKSIPLNGKNIKTTIRCWLNTQKKALMRKYQGMSIEEIKQDDSIPAEDKRRMLKLLELGIGYIKIPDKSGKEIWDENFELLEQYINSSEEIKSEFQKTGQIRFDIKVPKGTEKKPFKLGRWLITQKYKLMKKYQGMSQEEIEQDESIPEEHKRRMLKLLKLGVTYPQIKGKSFNKIWDENFELLEQYINSSEDIKKYFEENGGINESVTIKVPGKEKPVRIGRWVTSQRQKLMKKYQGMSIEEIKQDDSIPAEDKRRMLKLLELGVRYPEIKEKSEKEIWDENYEILEQYINSSEDIKKYFEKTGNLKQTATVNLPGIKKPIQIGRWLNTQKQTLMKKYQGMSIEEIKSDSNIPEEDRRRMLKLLELGVHYPELQPEDKNQAWDEKFEVLKQYINSSEKIKKHFEKTGNIKWGKETESIRTWLRTQKITLMAKYQGKSVEEIEQDKTIPEEDKRRMLKLLKLGVKYQKFRNEEAKALMRNAVGKHVGNNKDIRNELVRTPQLENLKEEN